MADKVLVTGASGFIGGHMVKALVKRGRDVRCFVKEGGDIKNLEGMGVEIFYGDVTGKAPVREAMEGVSVIYHLAGVLPYERGTRERYHAVNVRGTENILEAAVNKPVKKIVYFSSIGVTGAGRDMVLADEGSPYNPVSFYEKSKAEAEKIVIEYCSRHKLPVVILRPSKVYGPGDYSETLALYRLVQKGVFCFVGKMRKLRSSFCYVGNLVEAGLRAEADDRCAGEIFFISDERPYSIEEFVRAVSAALGVKLFIINVPEWAGLLGFRLSRAVRKITGRGPLIPEEAFIKLISENQACSIEKAVKYFNYTPGVTLERGMKETMDWYAREGILKKKSK